MTLFGQVRCRWYSPRRIYFWLIAPALLFIGAVTALMFWPGLQYEWGREGDVVNIYRTQIKSMGQTGKGEVCVFSVGRVTLRRVREPGARSRFESFCRLGWPRGGVRLGPDRHMFCVIWDFGR